MRKAFLAASDQCLLIINGTLPNLPLLYSVTTNLLTSEPTYYSQNPACLSCEILSYLARSSHICSYQVWSHHMWSSHVKSSQYLARSSQDLLMRAQPGLFTLVHVNVLFKFFSYPRFMRGFHMRSVTTSSLLLRLSQSWHT